MNKKIFAVLLMSMMFHFGFSQTPADCIGALPICNTIYTLAYLPREADIYKGEINPNISCLATYDQSGRWYKFASTGPGELNFTLHPIDSTYDFDWALFNLSNSDCSEIWSNPSIALACNFYGVQGNNGHTGANGLPGGANTASILTDTATIFYLYVSSYFLHDNDSLGYTLDFSQTTFDFEACSVISVEETPVDQSFLLFPNPASDFIYFNFNKPFLSWHILNLQGAIICSSETPNSQMISLKSYPNGIYIFEIQTSESVLSKKFVINK